MGEINWKQTLATGLITLIVLFTANALLTKWQEREPVLYYSVTETVPFNDQDKAIGIYDISIFNAGKKIVNEVACRIKLNGAQIDKYKIRSQNLVSVVEEAVQSDYLVIKIANLNPEEKVIVSLLGSSPNGIPTKPEVVLRGAGVVGEEKPAGHEKTSSANWLVIIASVMTSIIVTLSRLYYPGKIPLLGVQDTTLKEGDKLRDKDIRVNTKIEADVVATIENNHNNSEELEVSGLSRLLSACYADKSLEKLDEVFIDLSGKECDLNKKIENEAWYIFCQYRLGRNSALAALKELAEKHERSEGYSLINRIIASCYEKDKQFAKAADYFMEASEKADNEEDEFRFLADRARCLYLSGDINLAYQILSQSLELTQNEQCLYIIYSGLAYLLKEEEKPEEAFALEKCLELQPNNIEIRFNLAYLYGQQNKNDLAFGHYYKLIDFKGDHEAALNNIGVCYEELKMPLKAMEHYKKSWEMSNSLAAANLAYQYIDAGFGEEARKLLDKAKVQSEVHANVGSAIAKLATAEEKEDTILKEKLKACIEKQRFLSMFSGSYFKTATNVDISGTWISSTGNEVNVSQATNTVEFNWNEDGNKFQLKGDIVNRAGILHYCRIGKGLLHGMTEGDEGYTIISDDNKTISIMLINNNKTISLAKGGGVISHIS